MKCSGRDVLLVGGGLLASNRREKAQFLAFRRFRTAWLRKNRAPRTLFNSGSATLTRARLTAAQS